MTARSTPLESQSASDPASAAGQGPPQLDKVLGVYSVVAIVVGEVIGSGIFYKPQQVAQYTEGFVGLILALWIVCGLVNLCGALSMAELSSMFPHAGGTYVFLRETYGRLWSFLWAWAEFWVIRTAAIAALAAYSANTLEQLFGELGMSFAKDQQKAIAIGTIALLAGINILGTLWGNGIQALATVIKAGFVAFLAVLPFIAIRSETFEIGALWPGRIDGGLIAGIGTALAAIMWAYDGWGNVTVIAEEVHNPQRNVPLALITGVIILIVLYTGANLAYHLTLPSDVIAAEKGCVAITVCQHLLGDFGTKLMTSMLLVSLVGALNVNVLVGPRVLFAVARDHHFLRQFSRIHPRTRTPAWAIAGMAAWACALIAMGGLSWDPNRQLFDILTDWTVFGGSIFYFSAVVAVMILRRRRPDVERPYRTWGYPVVPLVFLSFYVFLMTSMFLERPIERLPGLGLIALGAAAYYYWGQRAPEVAAA